MNEWYRAWREAADEIVPDYADVECTERELEGFSTAIQVREEGRVA